MSDVLCIYYSFSGNTRRAMKEIADAVAFLASDKAAYITGQVLAVNGGMYC